MSQRAIHERDPQNQKNAIGLKANAFSNRAADEGRRDDGEHSLKEHVQIDRNVGPGQWGEGFDAVEKNQLGAEAKDTDAMGVVAELQPRFRRTPENSRSAIQ